MYTREQASRIRQEFWTTLGQYLAPQLGAEGMKVNWLNYKTGYRGLYFRMAADNREAFIGIVLTQKEADLQELFYEQFLELKPALHAILEEEWTWDALSYDRYGQTRSRIYTTLSPVSVLRQEDWPQLISFFKPRILALDEFWSLARHHFAPLEGF